MYVRATYICICRKWRFARQKGSCRIRVSAMLKRYHGRHFRWFRRYNIIAACRTMVFKIIAFRIGLRMLTDNSSPYWLFCEAQRVPNQDPQRIFVAGYNRSRFADLRANVRACIRRVSNPVNLCLSVTSKGSRLSCHDNRVHMSHRGQMQGQVRLAMRTFHGTCNGNTLLLHTGRIVSPYV